MPVLLGILVLLRTKAAELEGTPLVQVIGSRPKTNVTTDGRGVASHAGSRLVADVATVSGLDARFAEAVGGGRRRRSAHGPGRVLVDVAVMLADGGEAISDLAVLRDQPELFGPVASTPTAWRVLQSVDAAGLDRLRAARAVARERAWLSPVPSLDVTS